ncbi:MAG: ABC transporter substrate-binding protein [Candidatus Omnitrophica bacterium]|nr:ABC transporter substrate-binding protein [Candidatus Omnitrophota bacterium]
MKKSIYALLFTLIALNMYSPSEVYAETPGELVTNTVKQGVQILEDPVLKGQTELRREKLWELLEPVFSFEEIAKFALGPHWQNISAAQQKEFTDSFTTVLKDLYLKRSDEYQGGDVIYVREIVKGDRGKVQTNFIKDDEKAVVDFSMKKINNAWKVYDITIENVSLLTNYRTQFNSMLAKSSFEEVLQKLKNKELTVEEPQK